MNIKALIVVAALAVVAISTPAKAADKPVVHLDVTAGYLSTANLVRNQTNVLQGSARISSDLGKHISVYADYAESDLNRSTSIRVPALAYSANSYDLGATLHLSRVTSATVETGTSLNMNLDLPGQSRTNKYVGASVTTRLF